MCLLKCAYILILIVLILLIKAAFFILTYLCLIRVQCLALRLLTIALRMSYPTRYHAQFCYKIIKPNPISKDFFDELTLSWLTIHCTCSSALVPDFGPPTVKS